MQPRAVFRTHYQVDEPAYLEVLIRSCTSATESAYREVIAERFANEIRRRKGKGFNTPAAAYAVDLGRGLGLINDQYRWAEPAYFVQLVSTIDAVEHDFESQLALDSIRKLMHFRVFLEGDGAALLFLARFILESGALGPPVVSWNELAKGMFESIFYEYLQLTTGPGDRVKLRSELDRIRTKGYGGRSGEHKIAIHAQTLYRLGLIDRSDVGGGAKFKLPNTNSDARRALSELTELVPTTVAIEEIVSRGTWASVAARVFAPTHGVWKLDSASGSDETTSLLVDAYGAVLDTGVPLAPLATIRDVVQVRLLNKGYLLETDEFMMFLNNVQRRSPKEVRFHVDRNGRPAYLKLSDEFVNPGGVAVP